MKAGCCSGNPKITTKRGLIPARFHNEIVKEDDEVLDLGRVGCFKRIFCCANMSKIGKIFDKGIALQAQELNITSLIKAQRESQAACELLR